MNKVVDFIKASWEEITKEVTWPTMNELNGSTTLVIVASIVFALVVGVIDLAFENALKLFYDSF